MKNKLKIIILVGVILLGLFGYKYQHDGLCILGYHAVVEDESQIQNSYYHSAKTFDKQMAYLKQKGYHTLSMKEVEDYYQGKSIPDKSIVLTFDDGYTNFNTVIKPILKKYGFKATCFVIGDHLNKKGHKFLKENELINDETVEYYSHTYGMHHKVGNKKKIEVMTLNQIDEDFNKTSIDSSYLAYPYGKDREDIDELLKKNNVHLAFTYNNYIHARRSDSIYHIPRYMIVNEMPMIYFKYIVR